MMISESFSYVLLTGIVGALAAGALGMTLLRAFVENGPTSMMMTFQITLLPALIIAGSVFGIGVYCPRCRTPAP